MLNIQHHTELMPSSKCNTLLLSSLNVIFCVEKFNPAAELKLQSGFSMIISHSGSISTFKIYSPQIHFNLYVANISLNSVSFRYQFFGAKPLCLSVYNTRLSDIVYFLTISRNVLEDDSNMLLRKLETQTLTDPE